MSSIHTEEVLEWAKDFLAKSEEELSPDELKEQKKYAILIQNPNDKALLSKLLDESSQIKDTRRLSKRMKLLIDRYGVPEFFSATDKVMLRLFTAFGYLFDFIAVPIFKQRLRNDTSKVIINEEPGKLSKHLNARKAAQIGQNVNLLGEVVLGNGEADKRYQHYLEALKDPRINYISIKISGIYAQINALNYEDCKKELCERLSTIYQQAIDYPYTDAKGTKSSKFVNLDMEEYKDTELTLDVFKTVLGKEQFKHYRAGIVIQAYLPDAYVFQTELLEFAKARVAAGGAPLKMRLVKGANLQMETIVSSLKGWENPILHSKVEVDANYMHILDRALEPENARVLHVGVASHNFFSIGYAYLLSSKNGSEAYVTFEMLEGMANHLPRVMRKLDKQIILYTPVVNNEHFLNAVSYLVRRLDENTGKDNFLSYSFGLKYDSEQWNFLRKQFEEAYALKDSIQACSYRKQNRNVPVQFDEKDIPTNTFANEPDTNFDLKPNRAWADAIRLKWKKNPGDAPYRIPVQIGNSELMSGNTYIYKDRSQNDGVIVCESYLANKEQVSEIIATAENDASEWRKTSLQTRNKILQQVAVNLSNHRGDLIGCMTAITGKTFTEGDVEVSEAIDFCRYYPYSMQTFANSDKVQTSPKGIVLVISPWNFPLAIPVGGVAAALSGGNSVILKPATVAYPVAREFAEQFWAAGVPKDALQIVCTDGREPLDLLTTHPSIAHIILTGGTDTAYKLLEKNPECPLSAETGGKNAIIVTASADRDHAIQNIVTSAFSNAGQKCSACSLLLLEKEVYNDEDFKTKLIDAVTSLQTGSAWYGGNYVGPMITNNNEKLLHAMKHLEEGEWWLVAPEFVDEKQYILRPCVKWGVKPGSYTFENELFAPLLGVVCIESLAQGIEWMNEKTEYGLTSGLQSLDESEQRYWKEHIQAGNLYINRGITGAIVNRQPFGGMKRSAFGGGIKAGGPNYVSCFVNCSDKLPIIETSNYASHYAHLPEPQQRKRLLAGLASYRTEMLTTFTGEKDIQLITGERNTFRYPVVKNMLFRIEALDTLCDIFMILAAAESSGCGMTISLSDKHQELMKIKEAVGTTFTLKVESKEEVLNSLLNYERIRTCSKPDRQMFVKAATKGIYIAFAPPVIEGRIEMLHYLKEQSISFEYHRYGSFNEVPNL